MDRYLSCLVNCINLRSVRSCVERGWRAARADALHWRYALLYSTLTPPRYMRRHELIAHSLSILLYYLGIHSLRRDDYTLVLQKRG